MEYSLSSSVIIINNSSPVTVSYSPFKLSGLSFSKRRRRRSRTAVACASDYSSYCAFSFLNTPIVPVTSAGRFLSNVLVNDRKTFHDAVAQTLEKLVADVDDAFARKALTVGSTEAVLHRFVCLFIDLF